MPRIKYFSIFVKYLCIKTKVKKMVDTPFSVSLPSYCLQKFKAVRKCWVLQKLLEAWKFWNKRASFSGLTSFQLNVVFDIETSHLICFANKMTGFYIKCNSGLKWVQKAFMQHDWYQPALLVRTTKTGKKRDDRS